MLYFNLKMKLVFIIYQAVVHSCQSQYGYHNQYSDYEFPHHYPGRRVQRNLQTRFVTAHRSLDGPKNIGRSYSGKNSSYSDQNVVVVPYPVPVLIFPINKSNGNNKTTYTKAANRMKDSNENQSTNNTTVKNNQEIDDRLKMTTEKTIESNLKPDDEETEQTTLESESQTQKFTETTLISENSPKTEEENQKAVKTNEQSTEKAQKSTKKIERTQKLYKNAQESFETAQDLEKIAHIINEDIHNPITTKQQNDVYKQTDELTFSESNIKRIRTGATLKYRSLNSNAKYMSHRDKGPPHLLARRPKGPPVPDQGIRLRPTIERTKVKPTTKTDKQIRRRKFMMPKFGLVHISNDLAKELRPQLSHMDKNVI